MKDLIAQVLDIERKAQAIVEKAEAEGREVTSTARAEAGGIVEAARTESTAKTRDFVDDLIQNANRERETRIEKAKENGRMIQIVPADTAKTAADLIVDAVTGCRQ